MASAATLLSPRLAHGSMRDSSSLSPSPFGLDSLSFDDLVEWDTNSYFNNNSNSNSHSPRMSNATLNSNSTSTNYSTQPHIRQADYSSTSAHINTANGSDSIPPLNSTTQDLFVSLKSASLSLPLPPELRSTFLPKTPLCTAYPPLSLSASLPISWITQDWFPSQRFIARSLRQATRSRSSSCKRWWCHSPLSCHLLLLLSQ